MPASEESVREEFVKQVEAKGCFVFDEHFAEVLKNFKKDKKRFADLYAYAKLFCFGSVKSNAAAKAPVVLSDDALAKLRELSLISLARNPLAKEMTIDALGEELGVDAAAAAALVEGLNASGAVTATVSDGSVAFDASNWCKADLRSFKDLMVNVLHFPEAKSVETAISKAKDDIFAVVCEAKEVGIDLTDPSVSDTTRNLMYEVGTTFPKEAELHRPFFLKYVKDEKVVVSRKTFYQAYFKRHFRDEAIDAKDFEKECGIGVELSSDTIKSTINAVIDELTAADPELGWSDKGKVIKESKGRLLFADPKEINSVLQAVCTERWGDVKNAKKKTKAKKPRPAKASSSDGKTKEEESTLPDSVKLPDPSENILLNSPELLAAHLKRTGGGVRTRFPPEPNGYLHIGHAKSMNLNFGYAKKTGGICFMRFDDTNPAAEKQEFVDSILRSVEWLGHKPCAVTYSSDHFQELYDFAVALIKKDKAFVCHQNAEDMRRDRKAGVDSPWRNRPIEESLKLFEDMRMGKFAEGEAMLRMKGDMKDPNPNMRDMVAYRIIYKPHPHAGDKWCIYPTYDYTHCICDSLEDITHSLCTLEFAIRRKSYQWLLHELGIYCPPQLEFSRLNITNFTMSKRKLTKLVSAGIVDGWDDPRLPTLEGLRRKGYTADAINAFCEKVGITRAENLISIGLLEECVRNDLEDKVVRVMAVVEPLRVRVTNMGATETREFTIPFHPSDESKGTHVTSMCSVLYIDRDDFREEDDKNFFRLTPGQAVGLKYSDDSALKCTKVKKNAAGEVVEVEAEIVSKKTVKVKSHIHWVSSASPDVKPAEVEVRWYDHLFLKEDMAEVKNYLEEVNPNSLTIYKAFVDPALAGVTDNSVQFERKGFFTKDKDFTSEHPVWNLTVGLKSGK